MQASTPKCGTPFHSTSDQRQEVPLPRDQRSLQARPPAVAVAGSGAVLGDLRRRF
jgi:hypothetical protein